MTMPINDPQAPLLAALRRVPRHVLVPIERLDEAKRLDPHARKQMVVRAAAVDAANLMYRQIVGDDDPMHLRGVENALVPFLAAGDATAVASAWQEVQQTLSAAGSAAPPALLSRMPHLLQTDPGVISVWEAHAAQLSHALDAMEAALLAIPAAGSGPVAAVGEPRRVSVKDFARLTGRSEATVRSDIKLPGFPFYQARPNARIWINVPEAEAWYGQQRQSTPPLPPADTGQHRTPSGKRVDLRGNNRGRSQ